MTKITDTILQDVNKDGDLDIITAAFDETTSKLTATVKYNLGDVTDKMGTRPHYSSPQPLGSADGTTLALNTDLNLVYDAGSGQFSVK